MVPNCLRFAGTDFLLKGLLAPAFILVFVSFSFSQKFTHRDQAEIAYSAQLTLKGYEELLDLISQSSSASVIEKAIFNSYENPQTRLFYSAETLIEDNIRPSDQYYPFKKTKRVKEYLQDFDLNYVKAGQRTIYFSNFQFSKLKFRDYPYIQLRYTSSFRGKHAEDTTSYKAVNRLAEIRAEKKGSQWHAYIVKITCYDPGKLIPSTEEDVPLGGSPSDEHTFSEKISLLSSNTEVPAQLREANQLSDSVASRYALYQSLMQKALAQLEGGKLKEAQSTYTQAQQLNPYDPVSEFKIAEVSQLILGRQAREEEAFNQALANAVNAKEEREYEKAKEFLSQALEIKPHEPAVTKNISEIEKFIQKLKYLENKVHSGAYREAIAEYTKAIAEDNANPDYYFGRGGCYEKLSEPEKAIQDYSIAITLGGTYVKALSSRARLYAQTGKQKEALADYNRIIAVPEHAAAFYPERARIKSALGDTKGALEDYNAAIKSAPGVSTHHYEKGLFYYQQQQARKAILCFTTALEKDKGFVNSYFYRGLAYVELGDPESASTDFATARELSLNQDQSHTLDTLTTSFFSMGEEFMEKRAYAHAIEKFRYATLISPAYVTAWLRKGDGYCGAGDCKSAVQAYQKALIQDSTSFAYYKRGLAYQQLNDFEAAGRDFDRFIFLGKRVLEKADNKAEAWSYLGHAQFISKRYPDALASLNEAVRLNREYPLAFFVRGSVYYALKEYSRAIQDMEESVKSGLIEPRVIKALGEAYEANNQFYDALEGYTYLIDSLDASYAPAYKRRAVCYKSIGEYALALQDIERVFQLDESSRQDPELITSKGLIELSLTKFQEAAQSFDKVLAIKENDPWALYGKACVLANQNQLEMAIDLYRRAFQTKQIAWSDIQDDPMIKPVIGQRAFQELINTSF